MNRDQAIDTIEKTYPPDSPISTLKHVGRDHLLETIYDHWRDMPAAIIIDLAKRLGQLRRSR